MTTSDRLRRRRCLGLRIAVVFAVTFSILYRGDWAVVGVFATGGLVALIAFWRDCRGPATKATRNDTHRRDSGR